MPQRAKETFVFPKELGQRLRQLRLRAHLTQAELARLMGRSGRSFRPELGQLERGRIRYPSIAVIADYLRACRASFKDIADILDKYTSQPCVVERQARYAVMKFVETLPAKVQKKVDSYDIKTAVKRRFDGLPPEPPDKRLEKSRRLAASWLLRQKLEDRLHFALDHAGVSRGTLARTYLANHGRRVWGILRRTRGRKPEKREKLLDEARDKLVQTGEVPEEAVRFVEGVTSELFHELELVGELDRLPSADAAGKLLLLKPKDRAKTDEQMCAEEFSRKRNEHDQARYGATAQVAKEVEPMLAEAGKLKGEYANYWGVVKECLAIALATEPGSEERGRMLEACLDNLAAHKRDRDLGRRIAEYSLARFDELKSSLPPDPRQK